LLPWRIVLLESARLILRRFGPGDAAALSAYRSDPSVARYQSWTPPVPLVEAARLVAELAAGDPGSPAGRTTSCSGCWPASGARS
jgi:RimJ/RimL family protein N-acetyltransferase